MDTATTTSTPSSSATSTPSPAAPAISAPATPITPEQRPTMAQAFAADAARSVSDPAESGDAPAIAAPASPETASVTTPAPEKKGPIPFEVHETALKNARTKAADEALAKYKQDYGWAEQIPRATLETWARLSERMSTDPIAHIAEIIAEVQHHPTFGPQLRSQAARLLGGAKGQAKVDMEPDLVVRSDDGQVVAKSFSAEKVLALMQQVADERVAPLKQESEARKAEAQRRAAEAKAQAMQQQVEATVNDVMEDIHDTLNITDPKTEASIALLAEVNRLMDEHPEWSAHKAAREVRKTRIAPSLEAKATSAALDDLKTRAAAQSVNPAGAVVSTTHRPTSFHDKSLKW